MTRDTHAGGRVDSLDGLRTIAVLLVVGFHFGVPGLTGGYLGVDVFFVLSGFLITTLLIKELSSRGRIDLARFWARRFLRLMPAALLVILVVVVWGLLVAEPYRRPGLGADALWSLLYLANWRFISSASYFDDDGTTSPLLHVWSLAVEEQFYLVWPSVLTVLGAVVWRRMRGAPVLDSASRVDVDRQRRRAVALAVGTTAFALGAASALALWALYEPSAPDRTYMGTDTKIFEPLVGALAAAVMTRGPVQRWVRRRCTPLVLLGLTGIGVGVATLGGPAPAYFAGGAVAFSVCCAVLVAAATAGGNLRLVERTLGVAPVAYVGRISYGVYLWHWPVALWMLGDRREVDPLRILLALGLTISLASASYHLFELPIRTGRLGRLSAVSPARLAPLGAGSLVVAVLATTFLGGTALSRINPVSAGAATRTDPATIVVVGDSVVRRSVPTLAAEGRRRGLTVLDAARGGCPAMTIPALGPDDTPLADGACTDRVRRLQDDAIAQNAPGIVLWWSRYELADRLGDDGRVLRAGTPEFWAAQRASFRREVDRLTSRGATLVVVQIDRPGIGLASRCGPADCHPFLRRIWHDDRLRRQWNALVEDVAATDPRVRTVAIDDVFCRDATVPCDDHLPLRTASSTGPDTGPDPGPDEGRDRQPEDVTDDAAPRPAEDHPPTTRDTVSPTDWARLARPDGSHFSPEALPEVAGALLDRVTAAARR